MASSAMTVIKILSNFSCQWSCFFQHEKW